MDEWVQSYSPLVIVTQKGVNCCKSQLSRWVELASKIVSTTTTKQEDKLFDFKSFKDPKSTVILMTKILL